MRTEKNGIQAIPYSKEADAMATTVDEAIRLLTDAGVEIAPEDQAARALSRVELSRRLLAFCRDDPDGRARVCWDSPILGLANDPEDAGWFVRRIEDSILGLETGEDDVEEPPAEAVSGVKTFGDL